MKKYEEQRSACEKEIDRGNRVIKKLQARLKAVQVCVVLCPAGEEGVAASHPCPMPCG